MKGLMKYDLMQIAGGVKGSFVVLYLIILAILNVFSNDGNMFSYIVIFIFTMFGIAAFNYEEAYHWDRYKAQSADIQSPDCAGTLWDDRYFHGCWCCSKPAFRINFCDCRDDGAAAD